MRSIAVYLAACLTILTGCEKPERRDAPSPRIVTFAPHITDIAFDMGLGDHVVGVTAHCILPDGEQRRALGDVYKPNNEVILSVEPDVVFYNQKDEEFDTLRRLAPKVKLVRARNGTLAELRDSIAAIGAATGREDLSTELLARIDGELLAVGEAVSGRTKPRVLFVTGAKDPQTIGDGWVMHELLVQAGGINAAAQAGLSRWASINLETVLDLQPDVLICDVFMSKEAIADAGEYWMNVPGLKAAAAGRVYVISDRRLTIPSSRVGQTARKLAEMIHPDAFAAEADGP